MSRPNILLITTDQQRSDALGTARSRHPVMTPHLDQLAREGTRYTRAYTDCPSCVPARISIMSGRTAYRHERFSTMSPEPLPLHEKDTLPGRLTRSGYQTQAVGKMHFKPPRRRYGFERMTLLPEDYVNWLESTPYPGGYRGHGLGGNEIYPTYSAVPSQYSASRWVVEESINFLRQRDPGQPFFLWTSFEAPHPPFEPPEEYVRLYDGTEIPRPVRGAWLEEQPPPYFAHRRLRYNFDLLSDAVIEQARRHYYAEITQIDYELGRLFGELRSQGLWRDTVILFTSDHGEMLGDHGLFHKQAFHQAAACVPFILRVPRSYGDNGFPAPGESRVPVMLADILPTLLTLADAWLPAGRTVDGVDLASLPEDEDRWLCGFTPADGGLAMATNGRWKYLYSVWDGVEQVFELDQDPSECRELTSQASEKGELADVLTTARQVLAAEVPQVRDESSVTGLRSEPAPDPDSQAAANPFAWRGPLRYGDGW